MIARVHLSRSDWRRRRSGALQGPRRRRREGCGGDCARGASQYRFVERQKPPEQVEPQQCVSLQFRETHTAPRTEASQCAPSAALQSRRQALLVEQSSASGRSGTVNVVQPASTLEDTDEMVFIDPS